MPLLPQALFEGFGMMVEDPKKLNIIGLRGKVESSEEFIKSARELLGNGNSMFQFFDADFVLGKEHILWAYEHARRAFETNKNISKSMAMEILVYVSGEPQIANALKKVGIAKKEVDAVLGSLAEDVAERLKIVTMDDLDVVEKLVMVNREKVSKLEKQVKKLEKALLDLSAEKNKG